MVKLVVTAEDQQRLSAAVAAAEARTCAEIVPVIARDSGRYDRAEDAVGFVLGLAAMALVWLLYPVEHEPGSWGGPPPTLELIALVVAMILGTSLGTLLAARVPGLRRLAIPSAQLREEVQAAARATFYDQRIHHTERGDAVMIYVSLFERVVVVLPGMQLEAKIDPGRITQVCSTVTATLGQGDVITALVAGVEALGELLAESAPGDDGDTNEIADALILIE
jgi:putative membrane protein